MDVREILPQIQAPTPVLNRPEAMAIDDRHAAYVADRIPGAKLEQLPGRDAISMGDGVIETCDTVEGFISERVPSRAAERALASSTVRDLVVGSGIEFAERGSRELKGVLGEWMIVEALPGGAGG